MPPAYTNEFVTLYLRYERKLYRYVASLLGNCSEVDDLMQETARVLWQKFAEYRCNEPFLPWAERIAYYEVLNYCQRQRTRRKYFRPAVIELLADTRAEHDDLLEAQSHWLTAGKRDVCRAIGATRRPHAESEARLRDDLFGNGRIPIRQAVEFFRRRRGGQEACSIADNDSG
jgi:RNA polymerase sigma factor (sigma-70 family)